jgi:gamma-glutamyltranspeptidase/glutathione hydrolase
MDAWLLALRDFGRLRFEDVVQQALSYAEDGFSVSEVLREDIIEYYDGFQGWPANAAIFTPSGKIPNAGDILRQPQLAGSLRRLVEAERQATHLGREVAIDSVRDYFYRGPMGEQLVSFCREQGGLLTLDDMREAEARSEPPVKFSYQGYEVYTCDTWTQGPVLLQSLAILQGFDLKAMGHNTAAYLHTVTEALKLAFADRDAYYGDPDFVTVPHSELLSEEYCRQRRGLIDPARAWPTMPPFGRVNSAQPYFGRTPPHELEAQIGKQRAADTTVLAVMDKEGGIFCSAPSDPALRHIMHPELGFGISPRGTQSWHHPDHPSVLAPGKRPRLTTNPVLVLRGGKPYMALCTPGGDVQPQAMLQVFLNLVLFGMNVQQATEAPRVTSFSFPNSFYPHFMRPGELAVEERIASEVRTALAQKGHDVRLWPAWTGNAGGACIIVRDESTGVLHAGADPRRDAYAIAW